MKVFLVEDLDNSAVHTVMARVFLDIAATEGHVRICVAVRDNHAAGRQEYWVSNTFATLVYCAILLPIFLE